MTAANRMNLEVFTPALIFSVLAREDFRLADFQHLALGGAAVVLGSGLLAWPLGRWLGYRARTFLPPMMFTNSGNMGLPLAVLAFSEAALPAATVLFLVENLLHFTVGNAMLEGRVHPLALLRLPMLQATLLGIAVSLIGLALPTPLLTALDLLGQVSIPLMLFALGVRMLGLNLRDWRTGLLGAVLCPLVGLLAAVAILPLLDLAPGQPRQLLLFAVLPPAVLNYMLAERYHQEPERVASIVLLGNAATLLTIPLALYFLLR
jgi:malate permease and related proteins